MANYQTTHQNHLQGRFLELESGQDLGRDGQADFLTQIGSPSRAMLSPFAEAQKAAIQIAEQYNDNLWLCLSSGVDSECMALSFLAAKVPFRVAVLKFAGDHNDYDICEALSFCEAHNIAYQIWELNLDAFLGSKEFVEICSISECRSPQLAVHMWLFDQVPGVPVCSWNPPRICFTKNRQLSISLPGDLYFCYHRYSQARRRHLRPYFFIDTPELFYSFFLLRFVQGIVRNPMRFFSVFDVNEYYLKCHLYRQGGYHFTDRRYKHTGFENYKHYLAMKHNSNEGEFDRRFRRPLEELFPTAKRSFSALQSEFLGPGQQINWQDPCYTTFKSPVNWTSHLLFV